MIQAGPIPSLEREIPIFFSVDDNYMPYLDVALSSMIENASKEYKYNIMVLNTGVDPALAEKIKRNERSGFSITFVDISKELANIRGRFKNVYHFSLVTYYRLFIASLFSQYDKIVYLDCDLVVLGDISELYFMDIGENIIAAAPEQFVQNTAEFRQYAEKALGVDPDGYVNAGVLVMNLAQFRKCRIEEQFIALITQYDFDLLDPDQAFLNYLCNDRIYVLPNGWNKEPMSLPLEGKKNIVHYALYKKPWEDDQVMDEECFWCYAKRSPFYDTICQKKAAFGEEQRKEKQAMAQEILDHAKRIVASQETFAKKLGRE